MTWLLKATDITRPKTYSDDDDDDNDDDESGMSFHEAYRSGPRLSDTWTLALNCETPRRGRHAGRQARSVHHGEANRSVTSSQAGEGRNMQLNQE